MRRTWRVRLTLGLGVAALFCWTVMFLAGTDIWHDTGRPDFRTIPGISYQDLRAFAYAFYVLPAVLSVQLIVTAIELATTSRLTPEARGVRHH